MTWIALGLLAGIVLGTYDVLTKVASSKVDVISLVFLSTLFGSLLWVPFFIAPNIMEIRTGIYVNTASIGWVENLYILPKSVMMIASWIFAYYSVKNLPLSISAGVRATGPLWTALAAIVLLGEKLTFLHWMGFAVASYAYYKFSTIGKKEGFDLGSNKWALFMLLATLLSSAAQIYDRFLLNGIGLDLINVQAVSALQRVLLVLVILPICFVNIKSNFLASVHWSVVLVGVTMVFAEFVYLAAVNVEDAMISVISILRRTNLVVVYVVGAVLFKDQNPIPKFIAICGVVAGIVIVSIPSYG